MNTFCHNWDPTKQHQCHDCGVLEGELHKRGCNMERCVLCLGQLISCGCEYKHFYPDTYEPMQGFDYQTNTMLTKDRVTGKLRPISETNGLPKEVYEHGLSETQEDAWEHILNAKGRIPYMVMPNLCVRCGETWPEMFKTEDWKNVIPADMQRHMLCRPCYEVVKGFVLTARAKQEIT